MSLINQLLPKILPSPAATQASGGSMLRKGKNLLNQPLAKYGLELYASKAIEAKVGRPDGLLENVLQYTAPKYYNAFKLAKLASQHSGSNRLLLTLAGLLFPRHMSAYVLAKESGKGINLLEWAGIAFAPDVIVAANAARKDVFNKGQQTFNAAKQSAEQAQQTLEQPKGLLGRILNTAGLNNASLNGGVKDANGSPLQFDRLFQKLKQAIQPADTVAVDAGHPFSQSVSAASQPHKLHALA